MTELTPHPAPLTCRRAAFEYLAAQLPVLDEEPEALLNAAIAISMHELTDLEPEYVIGRLQSLADRVTARAGRASDRALLAHAHDVLFDEEDLRGNEEQYYVSHNSYISRVLETRRGLPITLCLIYKSVLERLGLRVHGVNAPGHFMVAVELDHDVCIIDPFFRGCPLSRDEAIARVDQMTDIDVPSSDRWLRPATHLQWLGRLLSNLEHIFYHTQERQHLAAMLELRNLLPKS